MSEHSKQESLQGEALKQALIQQQLKKAAAGRLSLSDRILPDETSDNIPLSAAQKRIWLMQQLEPDVAFANRPLAIRFQGMLDLQVLEQSLSTILQRHEALRTIFPSQAGEPVQQVLAPWYLTPDVIDLQSFPPEHRESEAIRLAQVEAQKPFDLATGPLIRGMLLLLSESDHILLLLMHHIVFDGWSEGLLLQELRSLYGAIATNQDPILPELPIQYKDFSWWQQKRLKTALLEKQLSYWQQQLGRHATMLELTPDSPRSAARTFRAQSQVLLLPQPLTQTLKQLSQREGVTLFMTLLTALQILLNRYTGQEQIAVGVPVAGRNRVETEALIGVFMNTLVLQSDLSGNPTFRAVLGQVRQICLEAFTHQELPFEKLVEALQPARVANRWPLFQVMFNFRNMPQTKDIRTDSLTITPFDFAGGMIGGLDLSLEIEAGTEGLQCKFTYPVELFEASTMQRLGQHFRGLLESIVHDPNQSIGTVPFMTPSERHQVLTEWNATHVAYPDGFRVHELVEAQADRTPTATAVVFADQRLTYQQLNQAANQLAHYLKTQGVSPGMTLGICVERSLEMVVGLLATLKAGAAYVPLDPEYPQERLAFMLQDSGVSILLTQHHLRTLIPDCQARVLCLESDAYLWTSLDQANPSCDISADDLVYIMYTSGTTGQPKGVMISHHAACNHLYWRQDYFGLETSDRVLQKASLNFDDSFWEIFEPLTVGAQLVITQPGEHGNIPYLIETIIQHQITALCLVPSLLQVFVEDADVERCTTLRRVTTGGERLSKGLQQRFFERLDASLHNGYGPTEATVAVTYWSCQREDTLSTVPIGRPISNAQIYLLDAQCQPVPIGVPGELYIGGVSLASGYLNRPDLTAERFIEVPSHLPEISSARLYKTGDRARHRADGTIEFLGRVDHQVKIRGLRVELGEIEATLREHPQVQETVVVARTDEVKGQYLLAYLVVTGETDTLKQTLRSFLKRRLPDYMLPSALIWITAIPLKPNGKIDYQSLPMPDSVQPVTDTEYVLARTSTEKQLGQIWCELLKLEKIGIHDNFFESGGHSLLATQMLYRISDVFSVTLSLRNLFEFPTIAELAEAIEFLMFSQ
ncbi:amino acid adenylation domain-containing protein [filamentous cyanobacterium LEGE 11480]|uniref:Amino acid adenylation domain-containing protein n=1 Tax=Romeriopsis navalis LEGE 11480 TaxID=2777977 RepID=A0A928VRQ5_9CYAN|nr:amino acid adenylation domain-containing protein [Romeriopsis navalis]MBE9031360.1 amino acid adenylation domain-containing protein [Romeriopsis navalis LEGE 11480]